MKKFQYFQLMTLSASVFTFIFLKLLREKYFLKNLGDLGKEGGLKNPWKKRVSWWSAAVPAQGQH